MRCKNVFSLLSSSCIRQSSSCELWTKAYLWRLNFSVEFSKNDCRLIRCLLVNIMVKLRNSGPTNTDAMYTKEDEFWMDGVRVGGLMFWICVLWAGFGYWIVFDLLCGQKVVACSVFPVYEPVYNRYERNIIPGIDWRPQQFAYIALNLCAKCVQSTHAVYAVWWMLSIKNIYSELLVGKVTRKNSGLKCASWHPNRHTTRTSFRFGILFVASKLFIE